VARKLTPADAAELLALAATFDRRSIGQMDAVAWADALYDLEPADCAEAIRLHFRETDAWLMPAHVRQRVKYLREVRADERYNVELWRVIETGKEIDRDRMRDVAADAIRTVQEALGETQRTEQEVAARRIRCPYCRASEGRACVNAVTNSERTTSHPSRLDAVSAVSSR
jgi:hypothetical protein